MKLLESENRSNKRRQLIEDRSNVFHKCLTCKVYTTEIYRRPQNKYYWHKDERAVAIKYFECVKCFKTCESIYFNKQSKGDICLDCFKEKIMPSQKEQISASESEVTMKPSREKGVRKRVLAEDRNKETSSEEEKQEEEYGGGPSVQNFAKLYDNSDKQQQNQLQMLI
jgi:hypothetical protein